MQSVSLTGTGITTTRLGFGTAGLMRVAGAAQRENLVAAAWDSGIRHFDTAPIYGLGESERILGRVLRGRLQEATITTKFGLAVNPMAARLLPLQNVGRALIRALPMLRGMARRRAGTLYERPPLDAGAARDSLLRSLAALGRERVECFLAHDCAPDQFRDDRLLDTLRALRDQGRIVSHGIATGIDHTLHLLDSHPHYCPVVQFATPLSQGLPTGLARARGVITHGALSGVYSQLRTSDLLRRRWQTALDLDLRDDSARATLFLRAALAQNPEGVVLFQSTSVDHIVRNAEVATVPLDAERLRVVQRLAAALDVDEPATHAA